MNKILRYVLVILATLVAVALLYQFRTVVLLLVISVAITATTYPAVEKLNNWKIPKFLGQFIVLTILVGVIVGLILWAGPVLLNDLQSLVDFLFDQYQLLYKGWIEGKFWQQVIISNLPEPWKLTDYFLGAEGELILPTAINLSQGITAFGGKIFMALVFSLYWAQDRERVIRAVLSFMPARNRGLIRNTWKEVEQSVGTYVREEFLLGLIFSVSVGVVYALLGLPHPVILAFLGFLSWFIPLLGFGTFLVIVYITNLSLGWGFVLASVLFALLIFMSLKYFLEPRLLNSIRYSSFLIVFWIVVLGSFLGFGGFLAGPIVAVALQAIWGQYLLYRKRKVHREQIELEISSIKERYEEIFSRYDGLKEDYPSQQLENIIKRLGKSIDQAEQAIQQSAGGD